MTTLYAQHFHLKEAPFSIAPNPRFLFMSEQHREALAHLLYGIGHDGGFVLLTGEVGTGKTTLCRCLLEKVPEDTDVAFIINPRLSVVDLLANICDELGISYAADNLNNRLLVDAINHYLLARYAEGRHTVLVIDEAQNLDTDVLEQLRLLTNLETDERKLLQIILLGQPELQDKLARDELRQLSQRVTARYHLKALSHSDMQTYITHRLAIAGCDRAIFSPAAQRFIYRQSKGIPRLINLICDRAMLGAFAGGVSHISKAMAQQAAREVLGEQATASSAAGWKPALTWVAFGILLLSASTWAANRWMQPPSQTPEIVSESAAQIEPGPPIIVDEAVETPTPVATTPEAPTPNAATPEPATAQQEALNETSPADIALSDTVEETLIAEPADGGILQDQQAAFRDLFAVWGIDLPNDTDPCTFADTQGLACLQQVGDLGRLRLLNRPAVLPWQSDSGDIAFITIVSISGSTARAVAGDVQIELPLEQLSQHWMSKFTLLWRTPQAYQSDILPGTAGPSAKWLNERLSMLDPTAAGKEKNQRISGIYQGRCVRKLRQFQSDAGLFPDGVAGPRTLIQLNTQLHEPGPRLMPDLSEAQTATSH